MTTKLVFCYFFLVQLACTSNERCTCNIEPKVNAPSIDPNNSFQNCFNLFSQNCSEIHLQAENYSMNDVFNISQKKDIAIIGLNIVTSILCYKGAGLSFTYITNLTITNISLKNCGHIYTTPENITFKAAVLIIDCRDLFISSSSIRESEGTGLVMLNVRGTITILNSTITMSKVNSQKASGGGGIYLELSLHNSSLDGQKECDEAMYYINNCTFTNNAATTTNSSLSCDDGIFAGIGWGGAMSIRLRSCPCYVQISVNNCTLANNIAGWGGAVKLVMCKAQNNLITFEKSQFINNRATSKGGGGGGGGIDIIFSGLNTRNNQILLTNTEFENNYALYGGGLSISFHYAFDQSNNSVEFKQCTWRGNSAHYASAVDVFPSGVLDTWNAKPEVTFEDCTYKSNYHKEEPITKNLFRLGDGVIMVTGFAIKFKGSTTFLNNSGSCIYAISSEVLFSEDVSAVFHNNTAENGAGIALIGFSVITISSNSVITFCNNNVTRKGGAIYYQSVDKHIYVHNRRCFIQGASNQVSNITVNFFGNKAPDNPVYKNSYQARSIYTTADLSACCPKVADCTFGGVGDFYFSDNCTELTQSNSISENSTYSKEISTSEKNFSFSLRDDYLPFIPGRLTAIPLQNSNGTSFDIEVEIETTGVVCSLYSIHTNKLILYGSVGEEAILKLTEKSNRKNFFSFNARLMNCPPFYKLINFRCICFTNRDTFYVAIFRCNTSFLTSSLRVGYWVGYAETLNKTQKTLYISYCPNNYCTSKLDEEFYYNLPTNPNELEAAVCSEGRRGILCGECTENNTVYFYSRSFTCGSTKLCHLGPLFYLLSEIFPLTILFLVVIFFNVSFTSGNLNGFIFYAQMYDTIADVGKSFLPNKGVLLEINIYRFFNLDFFGADKLSFCLWRNATTLSILMFKYVTVVYALVLVLGTVWAIRMCSRCKWTRVRKSRYSVIQGLAAFLVLAYSQCTEVSFSILNPISVYKGSEINFTAVFFQGNVKYFSKQHLPYAIAALLCILTFVTLLPTFLITYPLCNKIVSFLGLEENCVVKLTSKIVPITKMKPLLDCFQGTFKDNFRFFAGLYFAYRAAILATRFAPTVIIIYAIMELQFIVMLTMHTILWPYQKRTHNIIDALLIANLAVITILKLLTHILAEATKSGEYIAIITLIELIFVSMPLLVLIGYAIYRIIKKAKNWCKRRKSCKRNTIMVDALLLEDDYREQSLSRSTDSYLLMREKKIAPEKKLST